MKVEIWICEVYTSIYHLCCIETDALTRDIIERKYFYRLIDNSDELVGLQNEEDSKMNLIPVDCVSWKLDNIERYL